MSQEKQRDGGKVAYTQNVILKEMYLETRNCKKNQLRDLRVVVSEWRELGCMGAGGLYFVVTLKE